MCEQIINIYLVKVSNLSENHPGSKLNIVTLGVTIGHLLSLPSRAGLASVPLISNYLHP